MKQHRRLAQYLIKHRVAYSLGFLASIGGAARVFGVDQVIIPFGCLSLGLIVLFVGELLSGEKSDDEHEPMLDVLVNSPIYRQALRDRVKKVLAADLGGIYAPYSRKINVDNAVIIAISEIHERVLKLESQTAAL